MTNRQKCEKILKANKKNMHCDDYERISSLLADEIDSSVVFDELAKATLRWRKDEADRMITRCEVAVAGTSLAQ